MENHPNVQAVRDALDAAGARTADGRAPEIVILDEAVHTAPAAADALGVEVGQIANSLVFDADGDPLLVLTSGAHRVDTAKVAQLVGVQRVRRVAPVGHPAPLRTLVDRALQAYDEVWAAGGIPHAVFPTTFDELVAVTGGEPADVS